MKSSKSQSSQSSKTSKCSKTSCSSGSSASAPSKAEKNAVRDSAGTHYHRMNLSVSRFENGTQTDIRIHRETGKEADIYVSQGADAWTLTPEELDKLPPELEKEVKTLLSPKRIQSVEGWLSFFTQPEKSSKPRTLPGRESAKS